MPSFTAVLLTIVGSLTTVLAGKPDVSSPLIHAREVVVATVYQDIHYGGFVQILHKSGYCYSVPKGDQWYHEIASIKVHSGYTCDVFTGFKCDPAQNLKKNLEGDYENLYRLGLDHKIESLNCTTTRGKA